jgi:hypothetical protein
MLKPTGCSLWPKLVTEPVLADARQTVPIQIHGMQYFGPQNRHIFVADSDRLTDPRILRWVYRNHCNQGANLAADSLQIAKRPVG